MEFLISHITPTRVAIITFGLVLAWAASFIKSFVRTFMHTQLRYMPGPKSDSLVQGNMGRIFKAETAVIHEEYRRTYGTSFVYRGFFSSYRLCTFDTRALHHILNMTSVYQKPYMARKGLTKLLGHGILTTEDEQHKRQRRVMNPAFGSAQLRELTDIFVDTAAELRDVWRRKSAETGSAHVDALSWLSKAALDIIGRGGFGYEFSALKETGEPNELSEAFKHVFGTTERLSFMLIIRNIIPLFQLIPNRRERETAIARATMDRIGRELIEEKKAALKATGEKGAGRDLLTLLIQANMDKDLGDNLRMSDEEVLGLPTFLVAGHETTATTMTWCFFRLAQRHDIQNRLRDELLEVDTENPTMEQLNSLAYLDAVVRETLRVHSVVPNTVRVAVQDDSIPLETPFLDKTGQTRSEIKVVKGDQIFIPILALNRDHEIWGNDHREFKPERWLSGLPSRSASIPSVFAGTATFLAGPHSCIGYKFAVLEMKALLFHLIRAFKIDLDISPDQIEARSSVVTRPMVKSDGTNRLPIIVTAL